MRTFSTIWKSTLSAALLLLMGVATATAANVAIPNGQVYVSGTASGGYSFAYTGTLTESDTIGLAQTLYVCLQDAQYCVNGAGIVVSAPSGTAVGQFSTFSGTVGGFSVTNQAYGALMITISGVGTFPLFQPNAANGFGSSDPPKFLKLPKTSFAALGFGSFSVNNPTITLTVADDNWSNNLADFLITDQAVPNIFAVTGLSGIDSILQTVDKTAGYGNFIGQTGYNGISGIDFAPDGRTLYAIGYDPLDSAQVLLKMNKSNGLGITIGPTALDDVFIYDIAVRSDGTIFGLGADGILYTFNSSTGAATAVGNMGITGSPIGGAIAFWNGTLYVQYTTQSGAITIITTHGFYTVNQTTGAATFVGNATFPEGTGVLSGMRFEPDTGTLFAMGSNTPESSPSVLLSATVGGPTVAFGFVANPEFGFSSMTFGIWPVPSDLVPEELPVATVNSPYFTYIACRFCESVMDWNVPGGGLPSGVTLTTQNDDFFPATYGKGILSGTPTVAGIFPFIASATQLDGPSQSYKLFVSLGPLGINENTLPSGTVGLPYSAPLTQTGGVPPAYTWSIVSGPSWLSIGPTTGLLSGTPSGAGSVNVTVAVSDVSGALATKGFSISVGGGSALTITTTSIPSGVVGSPYTTTISASGGTTPYSWNLQSQPVNGLSINSSTGVISGTPVSAGTFALLVSVQDASINLIGGPVALTAFAEFTLTVSSDTNLAITTTSIPGAIINTAYSTTLTAGGGFPPYTWALSNPGVNGLNLNPSTGQLSGTPVAGGSLSITASVRDSENITVFKTFTLNTLSIGNAALPGGTVGLPYSAALTAFAASSSASWSLGAGSSLPPGLSLGSGGSISGSPSKSGSYTFTVILTDLQGSISRALAISIAPGLSLTTTPLPDGTVGTPYAATIQAVNGTGALTFSITNGQLPSGLTFGSSGAISGTPTAAGSSVFTVSVKDANNITATAIFDITVVSAPVVVTITTNSLPGGFVNSGYASSLAATPSSTWSIVTGTLPAGLTLNTSTGAISGTPTVVGSSTFTAKATSGNGSAQKQFTINIATPPSVNVTGLPSSIGPGQQPAAQVALSSTYPVTVNGTLTLTFAATGGGDNPEVRFGNGTRTANFTVAPGSTGGLFGAASNIAVITGTVAGTITVTAAATDSNGLTVPPPAPVQITVTPTVPLITSVRLVPVTGGFNVVVTGFSNTKNMVSGQFNFTPTAGNTLNPSSVTVQLGPVFSTWYSNPASTATGSQFSLTMPFSTGGGSAFPVASVSVTLTNSQGTSNPVSSN